MTHPGQATRLARSVTEELPSTVLLPPSAQGVVLTGLRGARCVVRPATKTTQVMLRLRGMRSEAGVNMPGVQSIGESWGAILQEMRDCNWPHKSRRLHDRFFA